MIFQVQEVRSLAVKWTDQQREAIETRGGNILVAAAAGSGKTAVLVERIIRMITDKENPVSIDRLLVLTFTDAAASEMKRKIASAIEEKLGQEPNNKWLLEQSIKVSSAPISTIHSFCSRIIVNNAHLTSLPAEFSLVDDVENKVLREKALDAVLESYYAKIDRKDAFRNLAVGWGGIKGDDYLRETICSLHDFLRSLAFPDRWIKNTYRRGYLEIEKYGLNETSLWNGFVERELYKCCSDILCGLEIIWNMVGKDVPSGHKYYDYYGSMLKDFKSRFDGSSCGLATLKGAIEGFEIKNAPRKTGIDEAVAERIADVRDDVVKTAQKKAREILSAYTDENVSRMASCAPIVRTLLNLVRALERVHQRYKREKAVIDFSDLEHGLLSLLISRGGKETPLCRKMREYYHEILLDEFQDTNVLQFEIFSRLSRDAGNLFMVGDVKQCIYKFRNADPSIFMGLYRQYDKGEGGRLIRLFKNFRSRTEVVDGVNYVFSGIMSERVGGIDYTEDEYLINGAEYPSGSGYDTEILLTDASEEKAEDELLDGISKEEIEAKNVAGRIIELVCKERIKVTDKETNTLREARFGDVAVLCRNKKNCTLIEEALAERGVSSVCETGQQYLESVEVMTVLSFLQIIDNPLQDIPLIAVMRSPIFGFTAEELALIRPCAKGRFYNAVVEASAQNKKAENFLLVLRELRSCAKYMGVDELVWKICNEQHYLSIVGAMPNGSIRQANLKLLLARCSDYEQGSLTGLFNFMRYIEMLRDNEKDLAPMKETAENADAVQIMTIHKSKGLEFPIVFLAGTAKKFFLKDIQRSIIWDEKLGLALDYVDTRQRVRFNLPLKRVAEGEMLSSLKAEEMRLLYVAMTRAKEKLIISSALISRDNRWQDTEYDENGRVYPVLADKVMSMRDWVLGSVLNHPDAGVLRAYAGREGISQRADTDSRIKIRFASYNDDEDIKIASVGAQESVSAGNFTDLEDRLDYEYPYSKLGALPVKISVSELKRRRMPSEEFSAGLFASAGDFATGGEDVSATERGTITHYVMQNIDIGDTNSGESIDRQIEEMVKRGMLIDRQASAVNKAAISEFFASSLGQRLKASDRVEREFDFYMYVSPSELNGEAGLEGAEEIILQGIADCFFFESDGVVLIDYKTDRVSSGGVRERSERYRMQIEYYKRGIEAILNMPVKESYLYFLNCGEAVKM